MLILTKDHISCEIMWLSDKHHKKIELLPALSFKIHMAVNLST